TEPTSVPAEPLITSDIVGFMGTSVRLLCPAGRCPERGLYGQEQDGVRWGTLPVQGDPARMAPGSARRHPGQRDLEPAGSTRQPGGLGRQQRAGGTPARVLETAKQPGLDL